MKIKNLILNSETKQVFRIYKKSKMKFLAGISRIIKKPIIIRQEKMNKNLNITLGLYKNLKIR